MSTSSSTSPSTSTSTSSSTSSRSFVAAIDQGTTSTRVMIFNHHGAPIVTAQKEHKQIFPASAWVEHDPEEIWTRTQECIQEACTTSAILPSEIVSLGITNQRETLVVWNKHTGKSYYNAIVWQDQRGAALCDSLSSKLPGGNKCFAPKTGLPLVPYFSASKLAWILSNVKGAKEDAANGDALFGTIDTYLLWRLTGGKVHATDVSNASRTLLFNIHTCTWDNELLAHFNVPRAMLPSVLPSSYVYGHVAESAGTPGFAGVPIAGILGDQQSALFGQACFTPGDAKNTYGTGCFLLMNTGTVAVPSQHGLLSTIAYQIGTDCPVVYALEGSVSVAGAVITWLRDSMQLVKNAQETEEIAASVPDTGGAVFVPAFNGLFAPHWRSDARGTIVGLSGNTGKAHIVRAALEAVAFQSKELLDAMDNDRRAADAGGTTKETKSEEEKGEVVVVSGGGQQAGAASSTTTTSITASSGGTRGRAVGALAVDGGMTSNSLLMQFQADIVGKLVVKPVVAETTALGAAYAAGLAVKYWKDIEDLKSHWELGRSWTPGMEKSKSDKLCAQWHKAVARSLNWAELEAGEE